MSAARRVAMRADSGLRAVVPVKRFADSKRRLAPLLSPVERRTLCGAMLRDVLAALREARGLAGTIVVTRDPDAIALADEAGADVIDDDGDGMNAVLTGVARRLYAGGRDGMLVLPADIPLVTGHDVEAILDAYRRGTGVTLVAADGDGGTNALACSLPLAMPFRFGEGSFAAHRAAARRAGIAATVVRRARVALDIDRPGDVARLVARASSTHTQRYLESIGIAGRPACMHAPRAGTARADKGARQ